MAAEGLVAVVLDDAELPRRGAMVEVNSETDFVARNESFQELVRTVARLALEANGDMEKLLKMEVPGAGVSVSEHIRNMIAKIGENISLRRCEAINVSEGIIGSYVHSKVAPDMGKIAVLVAIKAAGDHVQLIQLGKQLAMHIASSDPMSVTEDGLDADVVAKEKAVLTEQARESGKPENIIENMVKGRLRKFFEEKVLLSQTFVIDNETKIADLLKTLSKDLGSSVNVKGFLRFQVGEGIERDDRDSNNFAKEVAAMAGT
jgi:elongation factor Ts